MYLETEVATHTRFCTSDLSRIDCCCVSIRQAGGESYRLAWRAFWCPPDDELKSWPTCYYPSGDKSPPHSWTRQERQNRKRLPLPFEFSLFFLFFYFFLSLALLVVSLLQSSGMISPTLSNLKGTRLFDGGFTLRWTAVAAHHCWLPQRLCALILVVRIRPKKKKIPSRSVGSSRRIRIAWYYPKPTTNVTGIPIKILSAYVWHTIECASFYNSASFSSFIFCLHSDVVQRDIIYGNFYNLPSSWWRTHKEMDFSH